MPYLSNEQWQAALRNVSDPHQGIALIGCTRDAVGAVGRSFAEKAMEVVSIRDYKHCYGDGIHDDTSAFVTALNDITNSGCRATLYLPKATKWVLTKGLTVDISYVNIFSEGAAIDCTSIASGSAFTIIGSGTPNHPKNVAALWGLRPEGPGYGSGVNGFSFEQTGLPAGKRGTAGMSLYNTNVKDFSKGMTFGESAYNLCLYNTVVNYCDIGLDYPTGTDSGEAIRFTGGTISSCRILVKLGKGSVFHMSEMSFDYVAYTYGFDKRMFDIDGGRAYLDLCWLETANHQTPIVKIAPVLSDGNGGTFMMHGGAFSFSTVTAATSWASGTTYVANDRVWQVASNTGYRWKCTVGGVSGGAEPAWTASPIVGVTTVVDNGVTWLFDGGIPDYLIEVEAGADTAATAILDGVFMHNLKTSSGRFVNTHGAGNGFTAVKNRGGFNVHSSEYILGDAENRLCDGSFEQATFIDDITIHNDTALPVTSRTVGTNISIGVSAAEARTGSQSLLATTGAGAKGSFMFIAPIVPGSLGNFELYYKKPGAETGDIEIKHYYAILELNPSGIPVLKTYEAVKVNSITFTADAVDWTKSVGTHILRRSPHWATHSVVVVNMDAFPSANLYIDDVNLSVM